MNINTSIGLRDRSRITLSNFKGLDTLSAAVDVSAIHATDMKNLISRDGVNHKRFGWKTQFRIRDDNGKYLKIQGIFDFTIFGEKFLIIYAGKKFWLIDIKCQEKYDITNYAINSDKALSDTMTSESPVDVGFLTDTECKCYINGNKAYFIGCGDFLVFSKWNNDKFEIRRVVGNEDVYIPTTTENIGSEEDGQHYTRITSEERNILSPYTYNLLFGAKELPFTTNIGTDNEKTYENVNYYLDCSDFTDIEVCIETYINDEKKLVILKKDEYVPYKEEDKINEIIINSVNFNKKENYNASVSSKPGGWFGEITIVESELNIPVFIPLVDVKDAEGKACGSLGIKNSVKQIETIDYIEPNTARIDHEFKICGPTKTGYSFVYKTNDDKIIILKELGETSIKWTKFSFVQDSISVFANIDYDLPIQYDFTQKNWFIEKICKVFKDNDYLTFNFVQASKYKIKDSENGYTGIVVVSEGKLTLNSVSENTSAYAPLVPNVPNIKVKLTRPVNASIITNTKIACEFGAQGGTDRLFIVDNTGNMVRWSKDEDFTYFGEKSWCVCGTSDKSITGMDRLNDSTLLIVKEYSITEPSVFVIKSRISTGINEAGKEKEKIFFSPNGYQVGMGAVGEIVNFNGECIMVAKDGLYAVSLGENMTVDSRYVLHRSRQISNKLEKFDLSKAKCVSFNGKFFVYVGGEEQECYVADNKYTTSFEGDIQNVVNYEWWRWTNIPVNVWGFVENELWFGTEDGQLCSFTENFYDETLTSFPAGKGLVYYDCEHNDDNCDCGNILGFGFVNDIKFKKGDIFTPTCDFYGGITTDRFECVNGETRFYLPLNDYLENETIYINNSAYTIAKQDLYFSIQYSTDSNEITFYRNYKNKTLTVTDEVAMSLKDSAGNFPIWSKVVSNGGLNPSINDFSATLSHKEPVVSKWVSGAMDLGTRAYSKSLTYLVLTGEKDLANRLKYGLKTRFTHRDYELLRANNDLDFAELDLQTVSMDSDFASSYTNKLNIRNINFLMFYFVSDTAEDVALNSIQIEFKLYKRNIGVR